jgi:hypothetical protein
MTSRTVPKRISDFLLEREGRVYCDACIQERLGLKWRQQVQLITATLAVTGAYDRNLDRCLTCNEVKQVTQSLSGNHDNPARKLTSSASRSTLRLRPTPERSDNSEMVTEKR